MLVAPTCPADWQSEYLVLDDERSGAPVHAVPWKALHEMEAPTPVVAVARRANGPSRRDPMAHCPDLAYKKPIVLAPEHRLSE
jgi:hypothetical protein